jgi:disease resistance protein RPS2
MKGVPPSCNEDDVNLTSNVPNNKLSRSPPEVPGNQSFMLCNDHVGQNMVVNNNVINDSIQQTTQFPPSFPQTMVSAHA